MTTNIPSGIQISRRNRTKVAPSTPAFLPFVPNRNEYFYFIRQKSYSGWDIGRGTNRNPIDYAVFRSSDDASLYADAIATMLLCQSYSDVEVTYDWLTNRNDTRISQDIYSIIIDPTVEGRVRPLGFINMTIHNVCSYNIFSFGRFSSKEKTQEVIDIVGEDKILNAMYLLQYGIVR